MKTLAQRIAETRRSAGRLSAMLKVRIAIAAGLAATMLVWRLLTRLSDPDAFLATLLDLALFGACVVLALRSWGASTAPPRYAVPLSPTSVARIETAITDLVSPLGLSTERLSYWLLPSACDAIPSVSGTKDPGEANLVLPLGFLAVLRSNPDGARAMLAHELAHVAHRDTHLWSLSNAVAGPIKILIVIAIVGGLFGQDPFGAFIRVAALGGFLYSINRGARDAEDLADLVAMNLVGFEPLKDALEKYCSAEAPSGEGVHRRTAERIRRLAQHRI